MPKITSDRIYVFVTNWRFWVKNILKEGGILKFRFVKDKESYNGKIAVSKTEVDKSRKVLFEFQKKNPDTVTMWE